MKITVKNLKGSHFEIKVQPTDTVMAAKKSIEDVQGKDSYPCGQQLLIHNGKVLKDETTIADNKVSEDGFLVVMLSKSKALGSGSLSTQPTADPPSAAPIPDSGVSPEASALEPVQTDTYGQAASNLVAGGTFEQAIQQIMDMGGGNWDRETVTRALLAAYNNAEQAIDYLYLGSPETAEVTIPVALSQTRQTAEAAAADSSPVSRGPNSSPLNMFPQETLSAAAAVSAGGGLGSLDFFRNNQQFQALRALVQANPQMLRPMLQELGRQNLQLLRSIQDHQAEFNQLINEPIEGSEEEMFDRPELDMLDAIDFTPAEEEAIARLLEMGFDRDNVVRAFLACDWNEELAAHYLSEQIGDFQD